MNRRTILMGIGAASAVVAGSAAFAWRSMGSMETYATAMRARRVLPDGPEPLRLIHAATLAASGHNTQPWRFREETGRIRITPDFSRRTPVVDPDDHHLFVSLGCAAANMEAASHRPAEVAFDADHGGSVLMSFGAGAAASPLLSSIAERQSTRAEYDGRPLSVEALRSLAAAGSLDGVDLALITDRVAIGTAADMVAAGNATQMADPAFVRELIEWLRFNPRDALRTGDGLFGAASGAPTVPGWAGPRLFAWFAEPEADGSRYARDVRSSSGLAVFFAQREDPAHWVAVGRACQTFALQATALGLKHAFVNQPVEVPGLRPALAALAGVPGRRPDLLVRFGYGPAMPYSPRRPVPDVIA